MQSAVHTKGNERSGFVRSVARARTVYIYMRTAAQIELCRCLFVFIEKLLKEFSDVVERRVPFLFEDVVITFQNDFGLMVRHQIHFIGCNDFRQ
jgi:hypothetical protein